MLYEHFKGYWKETGNHADKIHTRLNLVFNWAIAKGTYHIERNPADIKGPFGILIKPLTMARPKEKNLPAPDYRRIGELLKECLSAQSTSSRAFIFQVLTATRGEAVRTLKWSDVDLEKAVVIIRPENDKASKEFGSANRPREVYLSKQAMTLLKSLPAIDEYVFAGRQGFDRPLLKLFPNRRYQPTEKGLNLLYERLPKKEVDLLKSMAEFAKKSEDYRVDNCWAHLVNGKKVLIRDKLEQLGYIRYTARDPNPFGYENYATITAEGLKYLKSPIQKRSAIE